MHRTCLIVSLLLAGGAGAATDPALPGPFESGLRIESIPVSGGGLLTTDVHYPAAGGSFDPAACPCPLIVFGHGFTLTRDLYAGHGAHWASRGYIVLIPNMLGGADHSRNADDLVALVDWALARNDDLSSFLYQRLDSRAIGMSGHSAGGLSALVAAARDPRVAAVAPLDPVDNGGLGVGSIASVRAPVAITFSEDHPCNANGSSRLLYAAAAPVKRGVLITGANHCDPLDPAGLACGLLCGFADAERQEAYRRYVTGWFDFWLRCDATAYDWVWGIDVQRDAAEGRVVYQAEPDPGPVEPCAPEGEPPGEVLGLKAVPDAAAVVLSWRPVTAVPAVSAYRVYRSSALPLPAEPPLVTVTETTARDSSAADHLLTYQVRAVNAAGEGP